MSVSLDNNSNALAAPETSALLRKLRTARAVIGEPVWVIVCMFGFAAAILVIAFAAIPQLRAASESTVGQLVSNVAVYALAVFFVVLPLLIRKKSADLPALLGFVKKPSWPVFGWAVAAFAIYFWVTIVVSLLMSYIPGFDVDQAQDVGFDDVTTTAEYIMAFVGLVILPPIFEEVLFRGYLFGRLRRHVGFIFSTVVTSLAFGFVHGQWNVGVDTFVLSLFLCALREYTGSLWAPMLLHAFKNGLAYFFLFIAPLLGFNLL